MAIRPAKMRNTISPVLENGCEPGILSAIGIVNRTCPVVTERDPDAADHQQHERADDDALCAEPVVERLPPITAPTMPMVMSRMPKIPRSNASQPNTAVP